MKILEEKYPKGSLPGQQSPGRYIDGYLYENLKIMAKNIKNDMTFLGFMFSSTYEVGAGKSVLASQIGEAWTHLIKELHGIDLPYNVNNCVFRPKDLIDRAFKLPKYSYIWLDEWEDLHYLSELGMSLRKFFRKCRQLNLFIVCICPNFFQLPSSYALSRSNFAIDVRFEGEFERGFFRFYNFEKKNQLYIEGKKFHNYHVAKPNFFGRFTNGYAIDENSYRKEKFADLVEAEENEIDPRKIIRRTRIECFVNAFNVLSKAGVRKELIAKSFGITREAGRRWRNEVTGVRATETRNGITYYKRTPNEELQKRAIDIIRDIENFNELPPNSSKNENETSNSKNVNEEKH